jgi:hypothetical protein
VLTVTGKSISTSVVISGLALANGSPIGGGCPGACGGGVLITDTAHPSFVAVQIIGNNAEFGGGLFVHSGGAILNKSSVVNNHARQSGGGVLVHVGSAELFNSLIVSNTAAEGGGVYVRGLSGTTASIVGGTVERNAANGYGGGVYAGGTLYITGTRFYGNSAYDGSALEITGTARTRVVNAFVARNPANGAFPSTNASARFDSSADSVVLHTTFANATQPFTRALVVNSGAVTVANTIVASYATGLSRFGDD